MTWRLVISSTLVSLALSGALFARGEESTPTSTVTDQVTTPATTPTPSFVPKVPGILQPRAKALDAAEKIRKQEQERLELLKQNRGNPQEKKGQFLERKEHLQDKKEHLQDQKEQLKERGANMGSSSPERMKMMEMRLDHARRSFRKMVARMEAALERERILGERIQSRIDKTEDSGKDITKAQEALDKAKSLWQEANDALLSAKEKAEAALGSEDPKTAFTEVKALIETAHKKIKEVHRAFVEAITVLKGLGVRPEPTPTPSPVPTLTPTATPTPTPTTAP